MVDRIRLIADVEAIKFYLRLLLVLVDLSLIVVDTELHSFAPGDRNDRIRLIAECRRQSESPVQIGHCALLDVRRAPDAYKWQRSWAHLSNIDLVKRAKADQLRSLLLGHF